MTTLLLITIVICITIFAIVLTIKHYNSKLPQNNCNHEMHAIKIWSGRYSSEYLSTCKKCGYQKTYLAKGTN